MSFSFRKRAVLNRIGGTAPRVRMQVFPLAADRVVLERFVDRWFNENLPPEVAQFRLAAPIVVCTVLSYDDMSDEERRQTGLHAQNEIYFLVMLERLRMRDGVPELVEHGVTTPFIFVDNAESALIGRDRFGFAKELCTFTQGLGPRERVPWAADPSSVITVRVWEPGEQEIEQPELIQIVRNVRGHDAGFDDATGRLLPPSPFEPTRSDLLWWAQSILKEAAAESSPAAVASRARPKALARFLRGELPVTAFNLRQMPHPSSPSSALYRDLIRYDMRLTRVQNVRAFAEDGSTVARPFSLVIRRSATLPIVERLGLRVIARERRSNDKVSDVWDVLQPVAPLYLQGDIVLGDTERLCWQHEAGAWSSPRHDYVRPGRVRRELPPLDDYVGGATRILSGAQPPSAIQDRKYLILPARREAVESYLADKIPSDCPLQLRPEHEGDWVPIRVAITQARPRSRVRPGPLIWQDGRTFSLSVPVLYTHEGSEGRALYRLVELVENPLALVIAGTVYAGVIRQADLSRAQYDWFSSTQLTRQHLVAWLLTQRSQGNERRVLKQPWLDLVSTAGAADARHEALARAFADRLARHQPTMYLAGIPHPEIEKQWVQQRITLAEVSSELVGESSTGEPDRAYHVRVRPTDNLDIVGALGLEHDETAEVAGLVARDFSQGAADVVPAVGYVERVERPTISGVRLLWTRTTGP